MRTTFILIYLTIATLKGIRGDFGYVEEWMPIPNEEIFRRLNSNIQKPDDIKQNDPSWYQIVDLTTENPDAIRYEAIKLVEPQKVHGKFTVKRFGLPTKVNNTKEHTTYTRIETSTVQNLRKGKKIDERNLIFVSDNNLMTEKYADSTENNEDLKTTIKHYVLEKEGAEKTTTDELAKQDTEIHEVTEATIQLSNRIKTKPGYVYSAPTKPQQSQSNYIKTFQSILGKYNINSEDKLTNYAKSRIPNQRPLQHQQIIYLPIPIGFSHGYNRFNHLPADPIIVFLSNFGQYLPYSYGIQNNFKNLYGYLTSNIVRKNNPFGPYKVFSDTDSSN